MRSTLAVAPRALACCLSVGGASGALVPSRSATVLGADLGGRGGWFVRLPLVAGTPPAARRGPRFVLAIGAQAIRMSMINNQMDSFCHTAASKAVPTQRRANDGARPRGPPPTAAARTPHVHTAAAAGGPVPPPPRMTRLGAAPPARPHPVPPPRRGGRRGGSPPPPTPLAGGPRRDTQRGDAAPSLPAVAARPPPASATPWPPTARTPRGDTPTRPPAAAPVPRVGCAPPAATPRSSRHGRRCLGCALRVGRRPPPPTAARGRRPNAVRTPRRARLSVAGGAPARDGHRGRCVYQPPMCL